MKLRPGMSYNDLKKAEDDEVLEKRSKNVREQTRNLTDEQKKARTDQYARSQGFKPEGTRQDRFGVGKDQRTLQYNKNIGHGTAHEMAHALMTPVGETLREHQKKLGQVSSRVGIPQEDRVKEEGAAFSMQSQLERRAGIGPMNASAHQYYAQNREPSRDKSSERKWGEAELSAFEEGRKKIDSKGKMVAGTGVHAKINERAALIQRVKDKLKK